MAKEVSSVFLPIVEKDLGNVIFNGYMTVVPNTTNKKRWQYKETMTAPLNLPSLVQITPSMKGWTNNYQEYFTQVAAVSPYGQTSGTPTMFNFGVHSFTQATGPIASVSAPQSGGGYIAGTHLNVATVGGTGTGATLDITVDVSGTVVSATLNSSGSNYTQGDGLTVAPATAAGGGSGFSVAVSSIVVINSAGRSKWSQPPHRFNQSQVLPFTPPNSNPAAIQYSFIYPVADNAVQPPIDSL